MMINRAIPHNRVNPGLEAGCPLKSREMHVRLQPRLLHDVFRVGCRSEDRTRGAMHTGVMSADQLSEGHVVAMPSPSHEGSVRVHVQVQLLPLAARGWDGPCGK